VEKNENEEEFVGRLRLPKKSEGEMFAVATQLMGSDQLKAMCEDNVERMCRIPGKLRKRVWIKVGDILIIKIWDFQPSRADVVWRFIGAQAEHLKKKGFLKNLPV
jgi:translation initiation factor 1A